MLINPTILNETATSTTGALLQINSTKLHVSVATLFINDNNTFLENLKQGFKRTVFWNRSRSEITKSTPKQQFGLYD